MKDKGLVVKRSETYQRFGRVFIDHEQTINKLSAITTTLKTNLQGPEKAFYFFKEASWVLMIKIKGNILLRSEEYQLQAWQQSMSIL